MGNASIVVVDDGFRTSGSGIHEIGKIKIEIVLKIPKQTRNTPYRGRGVGRKMQRGQSWMQSGRGECVIAIETKGKKWRKEKWADKIWSMEYLKELWDFRCSIRSPAISRRLSDTEYLYSCYFSTRQAHIFNNFYKKKTAIFFLLYKRTMLYSYCSSAKKKNSGSISSGLPACRIRPNIRAISGVLRSSAGPIHSHRLGRSGQFDDRSSEVYIYIHVVFQHNK